MQVDRRSVLILSCRPARGRVGFELVYQPRYWRGGEHGRWKALLPCDPLPRGSGLVRIQRDCVLHVVGDVVVEVSP